MFHKSRMASEMKSQTWLEIRRSSIQNALCSRWWWWKKKYLISSSSCWITTPGARSVISLMVMATGERERERAPVASSFLETWRPADDHRPFELASVSRDDADGISSNADWSEQLSFFVLFHSSIDQSRRWPFSGSFELKERLERDWTSSKRVDWLMLVFQLLEFIMKKMSTWFFVYAFHLHY